MMGKSSDKIANTESGLEYLCGVIGKLTDEVYCVVESTSVYHFLNQKEVIQNEWYTINGGIWNLNTETEVFGVEGIM